MLSWLFGGGGAEGPPAGKGPGSDQPAAAAATPSPAAPAAVAGAARAAADSAGPPSGDWDFLVGGQRRRYNIAPGPGGKQWTQRVDPRDPDGDVVRCAVVPASAAVADGVPGPAVFAPEWAVRLPSGSVLWLRRRGTATLESLFQARPAGGAGGERATATCLSKLRAQVAAFAAEHPQSAAVAAVARAVAAEADDALLAQPLPEEAAMGLLHAALRQPPPDPEAPEAAPPGLDPVGRPWWLSGARPSPAPQQPNLSLPPALRGAALSFSGMLWRSAEGWLRSTWEAVWVTLADRQLFVSRSPLEAPHFALPLAGAERDGSCSGSADGPVSGRKAFPLAVRSAPRWGVTLTLGAASESEREQWAARIDTALLQANPGQQAGLPQRQRLTQELLQALPRPVVPPLDDSGPLTEEVDEPLRAGYAMTRVPALGSWFGSGWRRRWLTVHRSCIAMRDERAGLEGLHVVPLRHATTNAEDKFVFSISGPFLDGLEPRLWCEDAQQYSAWLAVLDGALRYANPERGPAAAARLRPARIRDPDEAAQLALWRRPFLLRHQIADARPGLCPETPQQLAQAPEASAAQWRVLSSPDGVFGGPVPACIAEERTMGPWGVAFDSELCWRWRGQEDPTVPAPSGPPPHAVRSSVPIGEAAAAFSAGGPPRDRVLLRGRLPGGGSPVQTCRLLAGSALCSAATPPAEAQGAAALLEPTHMTMHCAPRGAEVNLHQDTSPVWLAQLRGAQRVLLFPSDCHALRGADWGAPSPLALRSSLSGSIPTDWERPGSLLAGLGGVEVGLAEGDALYIPTGVWYSTKAESQWTLTLAVRCGSAPEAGPGPTVADADL
eukprot:TRINITY_DN4385_c0_g2_i1.p1 TRINITY_DN4385_c0_g2~~TRINITY_DN4385_c0_g2_i1.p1  ORF type:complete len:862 (+),score=218.85 TRINITY_DN4385_c0_g2_i1:78-2588(+)